MEIGSKPFIIAELSGNFAGDLAKGKEMIRAAARCGCDAVKIQTYEPADMNDPANNHIYEKCSLPRAWYPELFGTAKENNIPLFSSVFAPWAVDFLEWFDCPAYKIASPESTRLDSYSDLVARIKSTGKLLIASSGKNDWRSIAQLKPDKILYCVSDYPASIDLNDFGFMQYADGFSDHTAGLLGSFAMLWAGASIIEKHFKLDDNCIDAAFSINPQEMELLCKVAHR